MPSNSHKWQKPILGIPLLSCFSIGALCAMGSSLQTGSYKVLTTPGSECLQRPLISIDVEGV